MYLRKRKRESARTHTYRLGEGQREKISISSLRAKPDAGLALMTLRS